MAQGTLYSFTYGHDSLILWCNEQGKYCPSAENEGKVEEWYGGPTDFNEVYSALSKHRAAHFGNALGAIGKAIAENFPQVFVQGRREPEVTEESILDELAAWKRNNDQRSDLARRAKEKKVPITDIAKAMGVARGTIYEWLKEATTAELETQEHLDEGAEDT